MMQKLEPNTVGMMPTKVGHVDTGQATCESSEPELSLSIFVENELRSKNYSFQGCPPGPKLSPTGTVSMSN